MLMSELEIRRQRFDMISKLKGVTWNKQRNYIRQTICAET